MNRRWDHKRRYYSNKFCNIKIENQSYDPVCVEDQTQFTELMAQYTKEEMNKINKNQNKDTGLWYPRYFDEDCDYTLSFFSNTDFWQDNIADLSQEGIFMSKPNVKPSEALNAFLKGPTISECASSLMACQHKALERIIGTDKFNQIFGENALNPFMINGFLYHGGDNIEKFFDIEMGNKINDKAYNPLYAMYDHIDVKDEKDIQIGDILHFSNVVLYKEKHPNGDYQGYNVICVGKNENMENLYTAFGGKDFIEPLTKDQICNIMLNAYNDQQTNQDKKYFINTKKNNYLSNATLDKDVAIKAGLGEIENVIRPNLEKLKENFIDKKFTPWYERQAENIEKEYWDQKGKFNEISKVQAENKNSTFATYKVENDTQKKMQENALKFAQAITNPINNTSNILIMSGKAGIGKTHLANSIANYVALQQKTVSYINPKSLHEIINKAASDITDENIKNWFSDSNLIVFDDCNFKDLSSTNGRFIKKLLAFAVKNNISMLFTSNEAIDLKTIVSASQVAIPPESNINCNYLNMGDIQLQSKRTHWKNEIQNPKNVFDAIANYKGKNASGLMIESKDFDLNTIKDKMLQQNPNLKIRMSRAPYLQHRVHDMYVKQEDHGKYDTFIIKVTNENEMEQFLNLISHVHDESSRIVILTESNEKFNTLLNNEFNKYQSSFLNDETKLRDRIRCIVACENDINIEAKYHENDNKKDTSHLQSIIEDTDEISQIKNTEERLPSKNTIPKEETLNALNLQSIIKNAFGDKISKIRNIKEKNLYEKSIYVDTSAVKCGCGIGTGDYKITINQDNTATVSRNNDRLFGGFWKGQIYDINNKLNKYGYEMVKNGNNDE